MSVSRKELILVFVFSLAAGLLFIGPPLAIWRHFSANNEEFVLAQLKTYRDEVYTYLPRAREIYDGHFPPADLSSDQRGATPLNALSSAVFAFFIALFGGNINDAYLGAQFVFGALIFALFYLIGRCLFKEKVWAFLFAAGGTLTPLVANVFSFDWRGDLKILFDFTVKQFLPFIRTQIDKLRLARIDHPLLVYPIYFWAIIAFFRFWIKPSRSKAILAALPAGLLAYSYFHTWAYWSVVAGILFIWTILALRKDSQLVKSYLVFLVVFGALLIPYFINYFNFKSLPAAEDVSYRYSIFVGRNIGLIRDNLPDYLFYLAAAAGVILTYFRRKDVSGDEDLNKKKGTLFLGFIVAAIVVWNIQLLLGQSPVLVKWRYPIAPVLYIIVASLAYEQFKKIVSRWPKFKNIALGIVGILGILIFGKYIFNTASILIKPHQETLAYYKFSDDIVDSWNWINANLTPEPKIISSSFVTSIYLMTYTSARPFLPRGHLSLASNFDLEERFLTARKLFKVAPDSLRRQLEGTVDVDCGADECFPDTGINLNKTTFQLYGDGFKKTLRQYLEARAGTAGMPDDKIDELLERYQNLKPAWTDLEADYVYFGPWEKQLSEIDLSREKNLIPIFQNDSVQIFKIVR